MAPSSPRRPTTAVEPSSPSTIQADTGSGQESSPALDTLSSQVQRLVADHALSQQQVQQMYASQAVMQCQMQALLAQLQNPVQPQTLPLQTSPPQPQMNPVLPPAQPLAPLPPQPQSVPPPQVPPGPSAPTGASIAPPLMANSPGRSLASYFPDVKPTLLLAIVKHEFDPGQILKIDPQMRDKPRDGHLQLSEAGVLIKAERDASPKEYPSFRSLHNCQERVSDSTKEQKGRGRTRNNGQVVRKCKALVKGCRERTRARGCVSSQEKVHTNKNLARATAKPRAGRRQSWQTCRSGQKRIQRLSRAPASEATKGEWD